MSTTTIFDKIKVHFRFVKEDLYFPDDTESRNIYQVTISYNGKKTSFRFGDSIKNTWDGIRLDDEKDKAGILETITSDYFVTKENYPTIEDFKAEFGYEDNKIARRIYKACIVQSEKLHKLFNDDEIELIRSEGGW
jgi:hypothetical protein